MSSTNALGAVPRPPGMAVPARRRPRVPAARSASGTMRRAVRLDRGNVLRISDGGGLRLTATSGVLWITEEGKLEDVVLLPGETHRLESAGLALALAHRAACVRLEVPAGTFAPGYVEIAPADGAAGRRLAFGAGEPFTLDAIAPAIRPALRRLAVIARNVAEACRRAASTRGGFADARADSSPRVRGGSDERDAPPLGDAAGSIRGAVTRHSPVAAPEETQR